MTSPAPEMTEIKNEIARLRSLKISLPPGLPPQTPYAIPLLKYPFIVPSSWFENIEKKNVNPLDLKKDLIYLYEAFKKSYPGRKDKPTEGKELKVFFEKWGKYLADQKGSKLGIKKAFAPFFERQASTIDNHTGPWGVKNIKWEGRSYVLKNYNGDDCYGHFDSDQDFPTDKKINIYPVQLVNRHSVQEGHYFSAPSKFKRLTGIICHSKKWDSTPVQHPGYQEQLKNIGRLVNAIKGGSYISRLWSNLRLGAIGNRPWLLHYSQIQYIRIPTLSYENGEILLSQAFRKKIKTSPITIIDVRANGGGDASPIFELLAPLFGKSNLLQASNFKRKLKESCVTDSLRWGFAQIMLRGISETISDGLRKRIQDLVPKEKCHDSLSISEEHRFYLDRNKYMPKSKGKFIVLTDRYCASDCEFLVFLLSAFNNTKIVGESTFGLAQYIRPGLLFLPNSRVVFQMATGESDLYGDGREFDGHGLHVDYLLDDFEIKSPKDILRLSSIIVF